MGEGCGSGGGCDCGWGGGGGGGIFFGDAAAEAFLGDFQFFLFKLEAFGGLGLADFIVEILIDEGATCFAEGTCEFGGAEFKKENKDYEVRESEDEDGADLSENGGEKFIVEEISDVAAWHFACGGGCSIEALAA